MDSSLVKGVIDPVSKQLYRGQGTDPTRSKTTQGLQIPVRVQSCDSISLTETLKCHSKQWSGSMTGHVPEAK